MSAQHPHGPELAAVSQTAPRPAAPSVSFCSHCGMRPEAAAGTRGSRVCEQCGLGLLLQAAADVAPEAGQPFVVIDGSLSVCAVSEAAERLLAMPETEAVNRHLTELLVPADSEAQGRENLAVALTWAARGDAGTRSTMVRPANTFGVRLAARIASCCPPRAALLIFD